MIESRNEHLGAPQHAGEGLDDLLALFSQNRGVTEQTRFRLPSISLIQLDVQTFQANKIPADVPPSRQLSPAVTGHHIRHRYIMGTIQIRVQCLQTFQQQQSSVFDMHDEPVVEITWTGERLVRASTLLQVAQNGFGNRRQTMKYRDVGYS